MDLYCIIGPEGLGDEKVVLPKDCKLRALELWKQSDNEELFPVNKEEVSETKQFCGKRLDQVFELSMFAQSVHQNIERIEDSDHYFCGLKEQKIFVGPVLHVIRPLSFAKVTENKIVFINENPIELKDQYLKVNQLLITPSDEKSDNRLIVVFSNGSVVVMSGAFILIDLPIVLVKGNGNYFTISAGKHNLLRLKSGTHFLLLLDKDISIAVLFMKISKQSIPEVNHNSVEDSIEAIDSEITDD